MEREEKKGERKNKKVWIMEKNSIKDTSKENRMKKKERKNAKLEGNCKKKRWKEGE